MIDTSRHLMQFDPNVFANTRVDVVGCGAVGAKIADTIARYGVYNLHLHDGDVVSPHNIANQAPFIAADIGRQKAEALADRIEAAGCPRPTTHGFIEGPTELGKVVFMAVDKMSVRKALFEESINMKPFTDYCIEVRMGVDEFRVYGFHNRDRNECNAWLASLHNDEDSVESVCAARTTVGDTAHMVAGMAVARFRHWFRRDIVRDPVYVKGPMPVEQIQALRPLLTIAQ